MNSEQAVAQVIKQLETQRAEYLLVGAFSSNIYGIPRSTKVADIVVAFDAIQLVQFCKLLGPDFQLDRQMMLEGYTGSIRNVVRFKPTGFDIEFSGSRMTRIINSDSSAGPDTGSVNLMAKHGSRPPKMS